MARAFKFSLAQASFPSIFIFVAASFGHGQPPGPTTTPSPTPNAGVRTQLTIDAGIGFTEYQTEFRAGFWYPAWAKVVAHEKDIEGKLIFHYEGSPLRFEVPLQVPRGTTKLLHTYVYMEHIDPNVVQAKIEVEVELEGSDKDVIPVPFRLAYGNAHHVLVLSDDPGKFNFLNQRPWEKRGSASLSNESWQVIYGRAEFLPEDAVALESLDAVILSTPEVRAITKSQWEAIRNWVGSGGRLLLAAGRHGPFLSQSNLKDAFGVRLSEPESFAAEALGPQLDVSGNADKFLATWPASESGAWDRVWFASKDRPFLAEQRVGRGRFVICAAALDAPLLDILRKGPENITLWSELLQRDAPSGDLEQIAAGSDSLISQSLEQGFGVGVASVRWVLIYLGLYNLFAMPINWWVCKRIKHPEWSWGITIGLALLFAWFGYRNRTSQQQKSFQVNELTLIHHATGGYQARATSFSTVFTPRRFSSDLQADLRVFIRQSSFGTPSIVFTRLGGISSPSLGTYSSRPRYNPSSADLYDAAPLTVNFERKSSLKGLFMHPWTARNFRSDYMTDASLGVQPTEDFAPMNSDATPFSGGFTNKTPWTFRRWWLLSDARCWRGTKPLAPGETATFTQIETLGAGWGPLALVISSLSDAFADAPEKRVPQTAWRLDLNNIQDLLQNGDLEKGYDIWVDSGKNLTFIGETEEAVSPLMKGLNQGKMIRRALYQEELRPNAQSPANLGNPLLMSWKLGLVVDPNRPASSTVRQRDPSMLLLPMGKHIVRISPERPLTQIPKASVEIRLKLDTYPKSGYLFPVQRKQIMVGGCPVSAFNFRQQKWDEASVWLDGVLYFTLLEDYIDPATHDFLLTFDCSLPQLRYIDVDETGHRRNSMIYREAIFDESGTPAESIYFNLEYNASMPPGVIADARRRESFPILTLKNLSVRLRPPDYASQAEQSGNR